MQADRASDTRLLVLSTGRALSLDNWRPAVALLRPRQLLVCRSMPCLPSWAWLG